MSYQSWKMTKTSGISEEKAGKMKLIEKCWKDIDKIEKEISKLISRQITIRNKIHETEVYKTFPTVNKKEKKDEETA